MASMVNIPTNPFDVVPGVRRVAGVALLDPRTFAGDALGDHLEVHHVVAWRRQMTLRALSRARRRVAKLGDPPCRQRVAATALRAEEPLVRIAVGMAARAVEPG